MSPTSWTSGSGTRGTARESSRSPPRGRSGKETSPITRYMATLIQDGQHINKHRGMPGGHVDEIMVTITQSVEGFNGGDTPRGYYRLLRENDPGKTRKQREFPTSAVHIQITEPWFSGSGAQPYQARLQIAGALRAHLAYHKSIPLAELSPMVNNIIIKTSMGYYLAHDSILVYDDIHGGLGLVQHLFDELPQYARKLVIPENKTGSNEDTK